MQSLTEFLKDNEKISFDFSLLEEYVEDENDFKGHAKRRAEKGRIDTGSVGGKDQAFKNVVRKADSLIENWMLNHKTKSSKVGIRYYTKDYLMVVIGEVQNFDFNKCTYNFKFFTSNKYYTKNSYTFYDVDFRIEIKKEYSKFVKE